MGWLIVILFMSEIWLTTTETTVNLRDSDCDTVYRMDDHKSVYFKYDGSDILHSNPCSVEFTKTSDEQLFCVLAQQITLGCETELEYHEYFVKNYIEPEKTITCYDTSAVDWCPNKYQDNIFIVIRKQPSKSFDTVKLRIYLKDVPKNALDSVSIIVAISVIIPVAFLVFVITVLVCRARARKRAATERPHVMYQTTTGTVNMQTGYTGNQPTPQGYYPVPQPTRALAQGDYHVHPMQTAYPVTTPHSSAQQDVHSQQYPSAPPWNPNEGPPPPSYESVTGRQA